MKSPHWAYIAICSLAIFPTNPAHAAENPPAAITPSTTKVYRGTLNLSLEMQGTFEPVDPFELRIRPKRFKDELIIKKCVSAGAKIAKGDTILELETDKIDLGFATAENEFAIASANLDKASADVLLGQKSDDLTMTNAKNESAYADARLKRWDQFDGDMFILAGSIESRVNDFNVQNSTDELDQLHKMYKSEDLTSATADIVVKRAVRGLEILKLQDKVAHAVADRTTQVDAVIQRDKLVAGAAQQKQAMAELQAGQDHGKTIRQTSLVTAQAAAEDAKRKLAELKSDRQLFTVTSPIDGIVVYGTFDRKGWHDIDPHQLAPGEKIEPDHVMLTIYTPGKLELFAPCPESQITQLTSGTKAKVFPTAIEGISYDGVCDAPNQALDFVVHLPAVDEHLAPGFKADVEIDGGKIENVLLVPSTAVWHGMVRLHPKPEPLQPDGSSKLFGNSGWPFKPVVVGRSNGKLTEIKSGLDEDDEVDTNPKH